MNLHDLMYDYPEELVAKEPRFPPRVLWAAPAQAPEEINFEQLLERIPAGDVVVLNDTQVLKRRVFARELEILFLGSNADKTEWDVLFPSKDLNVGAELPLPEGLQMVLLQKGRPQKVRVSAPLADDYFERWAELPLPPYIQKARGERHNLDSDQKWYQTAWAKKPGSLAAPTASLHFKSEHLEKLKNRGVQLETLTLHVGLGTFLPLNSENLEKKELHEEWIEIPTATWRRLQQARREGRKIWALGTTVTRSLEACALGHLQESGEKLLGTTKLFIQPGFQYQMVDRLMTNFHQPGSSLMALVMAFFGLEGTRQNYRWIVERRFRLFSYGDFSVWLR